MTIAQAKLQTKGLWQQARAAGKQQQDEDNELAATQRLQSRPYTNKNSVDFDIVSLHGAKAKPDVRTPLSAVCRVRASTHEQTLCRARARRCAPECLTCFVGCCQDVSSCDKRLYLQAFRPGSPANKHRAHNIINWQEHSSRS